MTTRPIDQPGSAAFSRMAPGGSGVARPAGDVGRLRTAILVGAFVGAGLTVIAIALASGLAAWQARDVGAFEPAIVPRGWPGDATRLLLALIAGLVVSVIDVREHRIPNLVTLPTAAAMLSSAAAESVVSAVEAFATSRPLLPQFEPLASGLVGLVVAGAAFFALAWFGTLGLGDVKLAAVLGAAMLPAFGWTTLVTAFVAAYVLALPHAAALLVVRCRRGGAGGELPFGPYLVGGAGLAIAAAMAAGSGA